MGGGEREARRQTKPLVRVESNMEEWPIFQLGRRRGGPKGDSLVVERRVEGEDGASLRQRMEVSAPGKYRLPGRFDYDVYSAVLELLEVRGGMPEGGALRFSVRELILLMGLEPSGRTYEEVKRSLRRIAATVIESDNAFWSNGARRHVSETFRLWDVTFDAVEDQRGGSASRHTIQFGDLFRRSFEERYLRGLDIGFYWGLDSPVAKRLYRLIDLKRSGGALWETGLFELQKQIPIGPYAHFSKVKEKLSGAHEELLERGFLSGVAYDRDRNRVLYEVSEAFRARREGLELSGTREETIAIQLLARSGLRGDVARDLVARHGPSRCTLYANALPRHEGTLRNPAGWLRRAIEQGFELPEPPPPAPEEPGEPAGSAPLPAAEEAPVVVGVDGVVGGGGPAAPDAAAEEAWALLLDDLLSSASPSDPGRLLPRWFEGFAPDRMDGASLSVVAPNRVAADYVRERFGGELLRLWQKRRADPDAELLILAPEEPPEAETSDAPRNRPGKGGRRKGPPRDQKHP